jgi:hypothetical protein
MGPQNNQILSCVFSVIETKLGFEIRLGLDSFNKKIKLIVLFFNFLLLMEVS